MKAVINESQEMTEFGDVRVALEFAGAGDLNVIGKILKSNVKTSVFP